MHADLGSDTVIIYILNIYIHIRLVFKQELPLVELWE